MTQGCERLCLEECLSVLESQGHVKAEDTVSMLDQESDLPSLLQEARAFFLREYPNWWDKTLDGLRLMDRIKTRLRELNVNDPAENRFHRSFERNPIIDYCPKLFLEWLKVH